MKVKTFILTFLMIMSCPFLFGQNWEDPGYRGGVNVAQIGEVLYTTLQAAINAADNNDEIDVIADIELIAQDAQSMFGKNNYHNQESYCGIYIPDDKAVVLDLNGNTISYVDQYNNVSNVMIMNLGTLTINDTEGDGVITYKPEAINDNYWKYYSTIFNCGTVIVNAGTIENTCETITAVTNAVDNHSRLSHEYENDCHLIVNGGTLIGANYRAIRQYTHYFEGVENRVIINDGTVKGGIYMQHGDSWYYADPSSNRLNVDSYLTINGGTITTITDAEGNDYGHIRMYLNNPDNNAYGLEINGGIIDVPVILQVQKGYYYLNGSYGDMAHEETAASNETWLEENGGFISGGTFSSLGTTGDVQTDLSLFLVEGFRTVENNDGTWTVEKAPVAQIGTVKYMTLQEAVDAVEDGGTITLIANETFTEDNRTNSSGSWYEGLLYSGDKSFTIDLGGFTIAQDGSVNDRMLLFRNQGTKANVITLKNGTINAGTDAYSAVCTASNSTQVITINTENINIIGAKSDGAVLLSRCNAVLNVKDGTIITGQDSYLGIECYGATVNIYDGAEIYQNGTSSDNGCLVGVSGNGTVNVYGGYGEGVSGGFIAMTSGGTINVEGGEWIANTDGSYANGNKSVLVAQSDKQAYTGAGNSIVNVTGGIFRGGYNCYGNAVGDAQINISGGNFNADPSAYVEDGYVVVVENGTYTVTAVARIGEVMYATLQAAVEAAEDGQTVTLLTDATGPGVEIKKDITIDLNGHDYIVSEGAFDISAVVRLQNGIGTFTHATEGANVVNIKNGAQLYLQEGINGTMTKSVVGTDAGWGTISSPVGTVEHADVECLLSENATHDMYRYNETTEIYENVKDDTNTDFNNLEAGRGYLYANRANTDVIFSGLLNTVAPVLHLSYTAEKSLAGFNLIGNPYTHNIDKTHFALSDVDAQLSNGFYVISGEGAWTAKANATIAPMESVFVKTNKAAYLTINKAATSISRSANNGMLSINVSNEQYGDVAYVSFNEGLGLDKISHRNSEIPMVYVPVEGVDYAIAMMNRDVTEIPVSFKAMTMGEYTISAEGIDCEFSQMTLVDRMTGVETNLLLDDYNFMAKSGDNTERFIIRLQHSANANTTSENFVYVNNDELIINNIEGASVVRILDVLGRPVAEYNVYESANISTASFRSGVYMVQMTGESGVKVQKIIID